MEKGRASYDCESNSFNTMLNVNTKSKKENTQRSFLEKKKDKSAQTFLIFLMGSFVKILQCGGDSMTVLVGRSPETEHSMSNWIKLFFHIWVGVKEGGEEGKQRAQVGGICTDYWWLLATGADWQQEMGVYAGKLHLHQNNYKALHLRRGRS